MSDPHIDEAVLNDYADGLLTESEHRAVDVHIATCAQCEGDLRTLQSLIGALAQAPKHIAPARDLRSGIAARTATPTISLASWRARSVWSARYILAAAAIALIVVSSLVTRTLMNRRSDGAADTGSLASLASTAGGGAPNVTDSTAAIAALRPMPVQKPQVRAELVARHEREFAEVESQYTRATEDLLEMLKRERSRLTPEAAKALDQNIRIVDKAIAETRAALRTQPDDDALRSLVQGSYERKLELLRRAAQLTL